MDGPVLASFHRQWPLLNLLVAYFANGEQMSRLASVLGAYCSNHRLRSYRRILVTEGIRRERLELAI